MPAFDYFRHVMQDHERQDRRLFDQVTPFHRLWRRELDSGAQKRLASIKEFDAVRDKVIDVALS